MRNIKKVKQSQATFSLPYKNLVLFGLAVVLCLGYSDPANAQVFTSICHYVNQSMLVGGIGPGVASIAVIALGVGASLGKVSWGMAVMVAVGISVIFGYAAVITSLSAGAASCGVV